MFSFLGAIGGIVTEGLKFMNEKNRARFMNQYSSTLKKLRYFENLQTDDYTDADIDLTEEELKDFLTAYHKELKNV